VDCIQLVQEGSNGGFCEHDNEHSGYITGGEFLGHVSDYEFLKINFASWS
jgi:hypothetical protein